MCICVMCEEHRMTSEMDLLLSEDVNSEQQVLREFC